MPWSDLPGDLLHEVYLKLAGLLHRIRFAAVCRSWRAAAIASRHAAPPALPWLICSSSSNREDSKIRRLFCPEDQRVLPIALPSELVGKEFVGAHDGGWVAALGDDYQLAIVNLFSGVEVPLPKREIRALRSDYGNRACPRYGVSDSDSIQKVVFSESPTSSGCILAAMAIQTNTLLICCPRIGWTTKQFDGLKLADVLFFNGQLYGLTAGRDLVKFEIGVNKEDGRVVIGQLCRLPTRMHTHLSLWSMWPSDIVELDGKLMMAVTHCLPNDTSKLLVKMYELAGEPTEYAHRWKEVRSLGDYALFIGRKWSKAVHVTAAGHGEVQRNCIHVNDVTYLINLYGHESMDDPMQGIKTVGSFLDTNDPPDMWILPPDF